MRYVAYLLFVVMFLIITACSSTHAVKKFPEPPKNVGACPKLATLEDGAKLSDVITTVNANYGTYYECAVKVDKWNEWYQVQKQISDKVK